MHHTSIGNKVIESLIQWAEHQPLVRAILLTSSRAIPNAPVDVFSDYDVILAVRDVHPFHKDRTWLQAFGSVLALYRDPLESYDNYVKSGYVIQYENGLKIDFILYSVEILQQVTADPQLSDELDAGYAILLDKDNLTDGLKPPTYKAYIPTPPNESQYLDTVEVFFLDATYVAKYLWRDDLMAAKHVLDHFIKQEHLRPMLEWHIETEDQWSVKVGPYGRGMKKWLRADLWAELENTYTGAGLEANWEALFRTIALFRRVSIEVGRQLGYIYPHDLDQRAVAYIEKVKALDRGSESIF